MSKKYTVDYFIKKFSAIPNKQWRSDGKYGVDGEPRCALGHCGVTNLSAWVGKEVEALYAVTAKIPRQGITNINDMESKEFPQKTPKGRILAALRLAKTL